MGRNLSLRTRRDNVNGLNARTQRAWRGRKFLSLQDGRRAWLDLGTGNARIRFTAKVPGTGGNAITVAIVNGGTAPVVTVAGNAITITTPVASTPATSVVRAVNFSTLSAPLVHAQRAAASDGTANVVAVGATSLSGGTAAG